MEGEVFILHGDTTAGAVEQCVLKAAQAARVNLNYAVRKALIP